MPGAASYWPGAQGVQGAQAPGPAGPHGDDWKVPLGQRAQGRHSLRERGGAGAGMSEVTRMGYQD